MSRSLSMRYRIGELDERIELQKQTHEDDWQGGVIETWTTQATVWAAVRARTGRERMHSDMLAAERGYQVVIRNRADLDIRENWRIVWRGLAMNIRFIEYGGPRDIYLVMDAEKGVVT